MPYGGQYAAVRAEGSRESPSAPAPDPTVLDEGGGALLLETGDRLLLE